jgi:hypothetical protein
VFEHEGHGALRLKGEIDARQQASMRVAAAVAAAQEAASAMAVRQQHVAQLIAAASIPVRSEQEQATNMVCYWLTMLTDVWTFWAINIEFHHACHLWATFPFDAPLARHMLVNRMSVAFVHRQTSFWTATVCNCMTMLQHNTSMVSLLKVIPFKICLIKSPTATIILQLKHEGYH